MIFKSFLHFFRKKLVFWLSLLAVVVCFSIGFFGGFNGIDNNLYDLLLKISPESEAADNILLIDIDDESLDAVGTWPWTRDIMADVLVTMKELGASDVTFDIEYLSPSQHGINPYTLAQVPSLLTESEHTVTTVMEQLAQAVADGQIEPKHFPEMNAGVTQDNIAPVFSSLHNALDNLSRDNDDYFGRTLQFFGNSWLTVNYMDVVSTTQEDIDYVKQRFMLDNVSDNENLIHKTNRNTFSLQPELTEGFSPAQDILMQRAAGAGFTNVVVDNDGIRRRIELLYQKDGLFLPQLVFAPLVNQLNVQYIERHKKSIVLKGVRLPGDSTWTDIEIPLDRDGYMLINWQHRIYDESFRHIPVISLLNLAATEDKILACLDWFYNECYLLSADGSWLSYYTDSSRLLEEYDFLSQQKQNLLSKCDGFDAQDKPLGGTILQDEYDKYFQGRRTFFENCSAFAQGTWMQEMESRLEELVQEGLPTGEVAAFHDAVMEVYEALKGNLELYTEEFAYLSQMMENAFCIVGNKSTGNTDMGTTPFAPRYPNVGTHANLYNTIIQQDFIYPVNWEVSFFVSAVFVLLFTWFTNNKKNTFRTIIGFFFIVMLPVISILLMYFKSIFLPISAAFILAFAGYAMDVIFRFTSAEHDKRFLKQAFSTYLSEDVVEDIVSNPEKLALGGTEKNMTALFSDIKGFSSISEKSTPQQLVSVLNDYLTSMSDTILEEKGTIDKYIGDAIVSFFGAPTDLEDHAFRACVAAVRMKQAETILNQRIFQNKTLPSSILTRIGINTGKMVVGNMGTDRKMNYTVMGNNVNIASRLEGVNKIYGTWIIASESTWNDANSDKNQGQLVARRLDKVRVMGIEQPIQLYNIIGFASELPNEELEAIDMFHRGLDLYLDRHFDTALKYFHMAMKANPFDTVSDVFIKRCQKYMEEPPAPSWNGVMTMMSK